MNTIKDELTRLELGRVASISPDLDGLKARSTLSSCGRATMTGTIRSWSGTAWWRGSLLVTRDPRPPSRTAVRLTDGDCVNRPAYKPYDR